MTDASYAEVVFDSVNDATADMLIAALAEEGFDGFEELPGQLKAYVPLARFERERIDEIAAAWHAGFSVAVIAPRNWNELWEAGVTPVVVDDFCTVRPHFYKGAVNTDYDIVVTPKMSFGTGHHATTQLVIRAMRNLDFRDKKVFDFGTGTGVLGILAEKLGAAHVLAVDNDEWAVTNAHENVVTNNCTLTVVLPGGVEEASRDTYDIVLANINRNVLLGNMEALYGLTGSKGILVMSGLLEKDSGVIDAAALAAGFVGGQVNELNGWISMVYNKS